jgi:hypothetical protein
VRKKGMNEPKFIISEKQILNAVKYALELNIQEQKIVDILMHDVEDEIETVLYDDCEEVEEKKKAVVIRKCPRIVEFKEKLKSGLLKVGDELVTTDIDGEAVFVVAHLKDGKAYMVRKWLLDNSEERPLIDHEFNAFEWLNGEYRKTLSEELQEMIVGDVTLPSEKEVFGQNRYGLDEEGEQFEWFKTVTNRVAAYRSDDEYTRWWWTRTKADNVSASYFAYVTHDGDAAYTAPSYPWLGLRPHVILKA